MKHRITNLHSVSRSYINDQGQEITFRPGETKTLKTKPPRGDGLWRIEAVEETVKPEDTETKQEGGDN